MASSRSGLSSKHHASDGSHQVQPPPLKLTLCNFCDVDFGSHDPKLAQMATPMCLATFTRKRRGSRAVVIDMKPLTLGQKRFVVGIDASVLLFAVGNEFLDWGPVRQIEIYDTGPVLFYDREHLDDKYGGLAEGNE